MSNMLSPEAKEFIPRQQPLVNDAGGVTNETPLSDVTEPPIGQQLNGLPVYMTTCFPFVQANDPRLARGQGRGKVGQQQVFMPCQPLQPDMLRNRLPSPNKGYMRGWEADFYQNFSNIPNGMPFDGGTYQNGFVRPGVPLLPNDPKNSMGLRQPYQAHFPQNRGSEFYTEPGTDGSKQKRKNKQKKKDQALEEMSPRSATAFITSSIQTDFPDNIANSTLDDLPNSLYSPTSTDLHKLHTREPSVTFDLDHYHSNSSIVKQRQSLGTTPSLANGFFDGTHSVVASHLTKYTGSTSATGLPGALSGWSSGLEVARDNIHSMQTMDNSVPYSLHDNSYIPSLNCSYSSIAQKGPSQNNYSMVAGQQGNSSVAVATSDQKTCDNSNKHDKANRRVPKNMAKSGYGNVNVVDLMQDLERADVLSGSKGSTLEVKVKKSSVSNTYQANSEVKMSYSRVLQEPKKVPVVSLQHVKSQTGNLVLGGNNVKGQGYIQGHGKQGAKSDLSSKPGENLSESNHEVVNSQNQPVSDNNNNEGEVKKKRKRRRRKKKTDDDAVANDDANSGANEEITLHFEDEEEFPDLGMGESGEAKGDHPDSASISYSEIVQHNTLVQSTYVSSQDEGCRSQSNTGAVAGKESRSSRKRRKRREVANKAADAEMAEINLEQHMLELKMKQKLPLAPKKSASPVRSGVSPVRNPPTQGVWKLTPSSPTTQPSSSGKKVSLLLPGTVATETNTTPHQPNPTVKQPGILKTSQPAASNKNNASGSGKKSKQPITYDIGAMIDALETKKDTTVKETKAVVVKKDGAKPHNILDSSAPMLKRGKERETPKTKKPSPLKKVILKEREEKKRLRMLDEDEVNSGMCMPVSAFPNSPISAPVGIGVVSGGESDLSQDATSFRGSAEVGLGTPASAELSPISQPSPSCISPMSPGASPLSSGVNSPITGAIQQTVKLKIHSRRFREYCNQVLDKDIDAHVTALLQDLVRFQDKQYHKDPTKAKSKRRFVLGLREVTKHLKLRRIKCVVISPNLEKIQSKGGLDDALNTILEICNEQKVPFIFSLGRRALGRACAKLVPVSAVGIFNYEGSEDNFRLLVQLTEKAREQYREMIVQIEKEIAEHPPRVSVPGVPHIFAHMGHSRTPSGCSVLSFTSSILSEPISENYPHSEPETDHRGYEIEKDDDIDDDEGNDDAYEADDESGFDGKRKKRAKDKSKNTLDEKSNSLPDDTDYIIVNSGDNLGGNISGNIGLSGDRSPPRRPGILKNSTERLRNQELQNGTDSVQKVVEIIEYSDNKISSQPGGNTRSENNNNNISASKVGQFSQSNSDNARISGEFGNGGLAEHTDDNDLTDKDLDFETCEEKSDLDEFETENQDTVKDLPQFIDSVHTFDLTEILSQHSTKTVENGEDVLSTHSSKTTYSSRTLEGSVPRTLESTGLSGERGLDLKTKDNAVLLKGKAKMDKENRTLSWVKETQSLHFSEQIEQGKELDEGITEVTIECLDAAA